MLLSDPLAHLGVSANVLVDAARYLADRGLPLIALGGGGYDTQSTVRGWTRVWAAMIGKEPEDSFAGAVGGMMFGPEMQAGTLIDPPVITNGERKALAVKEAARVGGYIEREVLPLLSNG